MPGLIVLPRQPGWAGPWPACFWLFAHTACRSAPPDTHFCTQEENVFENHIWSRLCLSDQGTIGEKVKRPYRYSALIPSSASVDAHLCLKPGNDLDTGAIIEHNWFIPKDIWRIFYSKGLMDFFLLQWQIYCLTGATFKHVHRINNIFKLILSNTLFKRKSLVRHTPKIFFVSS